MRTALSSAAAPRAPLDDLLAGLTRHGLDSVACGSRAADPVERVRRTAPMVEEIA
jgi:hypothetical protein